MPIISVLVTPTRLFFGHGKRKTIVVTNEGEFDEIVRINENEGDVAASAIILYNRETYRITGKYAKRQWWAISTATVNVSWSEMR